MQLGFWVVRGEPTRRDSCVKGNGDRGYASGGRRLVQWRCCADEC